MKKILSIVILAALIICLCPAAVSAGYVMKDAEISYKESLTTFATNPGRGGASYTDSSNWLIVRDGALYTTGGSKYTPSISDFTKKGIYTPMFMFAAYSAGNLESNYSGRQNGREKGRVGGENKDIDDEALAAIGEVFRCIKENGAVAIPRFAYDYRGYVGMEPDDINQILRHIDQIASVLNQYVGTVISIEAGTIGPYGEMWGSKYLYANTDKPNGSDLILAEWANKMDPSIMIQTRTMGFIIVSAGVKAKDFAKDYSVINGTPAERMGMYNDGYLGTNMDYGTWGGVDTYNQSRAQGMQFLDYQGEKVPYGGELAYVDSKEYLIGNKSPMFEGADFLKELYDSHLTYLRNIDEKIVTANTLKEITLTEDMAFEGMPDISAYYGQNMNKFMLDHMGYRFVIRSAKLSAGAEPGGRVDIQGSIENTGFSGIYFTPYTELIIIDSKGKEYIFDSDIDAKNWKSSTTSTYEASIDLPSDISEGTAEIFLRVATAKADTLSDRSKGAVAFANEGVYVKDLGANYLGLFKVVGDSFDPDNGTGHHFDHYAGKKPTCTEPGWKEYDVCDKCGYTTFEEIPAPGHKYSSEIIEPTCTEDGYTLHVCQNCNDTYMDEYVDALGHDWGEWTVIKEPTTTEEGIEERVCRRDPEHTVSRLLSKLTVTINFTDVVETEYYAKPVQWAVERGITAGTSETTFSPNDYCTRGQIVSFLWRSAGKPEPAGASNPFTDVKPDDYFYKAVLWAVENEITAGTSDTTFSPAAICTRGQTVTFLYRSAGRPEVTSSANPFKDVSADQYYYKPVLWAVERNITAGTSDTTFSPDAYCTRGQIVTFLYRAEK